MTNNDILRRLRYALHLTDVQMAKVISHTGEKVMPAEVKRWLLKEEMDGFQEIPDSGLCRFLDGLIIEKRGVRPDGLVPEPLEFLSTNEVLKKLRIALNLREEGMLAIFEKEQFAISKAELGSFFRKEGQRNYAKCPEQVLRKFLQGLGKGRRAD
ncbi:MAG: DUF1456 family protein [Luteolibacter sp.]